MLSGRNFTVIGGGIAGLATASALASKKGHVSLLEKSPVFAEVGAGLQITPNGMHVIDALGLGEHARDSGIAPEAVELRDYKTGRRVASVDLGKYARHKDYLLLHRADLVDILAEAARANGVAIRRNVEVEDLEETEAGVELSLKDRNPELADMVVGADGLHSRVHKYLNGDDKPFFTEQVAWRALVKGNMSRNSVQVFMGPKKHIVAYPLRGGSLINIVAVEERNDWVEEGWSHAGNADEMRERFKAFQGQAADLLDEVTDCLVWGLFRHRVARKWHGERTVLVGDAAHPTLPFLAQGANMALEDAAVLASKLAAHELGGALSDYQVTRNKRVQKIVGAANANARNFHLAPGPTRLLAHAGLMVANRLYPGGFNRRFDWIYKYQATTV